MKIDGDIFQLFKVVSDEYFFPDGSIDFYMKKIKRKAINEFSLVALTYARNCDETSRSRLMLIEMMNFWQFH